MYVAATDVIELNLMQLDVSKDLSSFVELRLIFSATPYLIQ